MFRRGLRLDIVVVVVVALWTLSDVISPNGPMLGEEPGDGEEEPSELAVKLVECVEGVNNAEVVQDEEEGFEIVARSPAAPVGVWNMMRPVSYMDLSDFLIRSHQALIWEKYSWLLMALHRDGKDMVGGVTLKQTGAANCIEYICGLVLVSGTYFSFWVKIHCSSNILWLTGPK
mgnify:CR=1 FL=1